VSPWRFFIEVPLGCPKSGARRGKEEGKKEKGKETAGDPKPQEGGKKASYTTAVRRRTKEAGKKEKGGKVTPREGGSC